jgi:hypothetical protein
MSCENYREALIEAAAADAEPPRELRLHLEACASCCAAFAQEWQLFAAIDTGLHASANAEVPASFFPGVRARLDEAVASRFQWQGALIFAAASAAIVLTTFLALRPHERISGKDSSQVSSRASAPSVETPDTSASVAVSEHPAIPAISDLPGAQHHKNSAQVNLSAANAFEVIVPAEEHDAFARFISSQPVGNDVPAIALGAVSAPEKKDEPMSLAPLQIAQLEVRPLEALASEVPDGSEDRQ